MHSITRTASILAIAAGVAWTLKFAAITADDGSAEPLGSVLWIAGLAAQIAAVVAIAWHATRARSGTARVAAAAALTLAIALASSALQIGVAALVGSRYDGGNVGIEQEAGTLAVALVWLAIGVAALWNRTPAPVARPT